MYIVAVFALVRGEAHFGSRAIPHTTLALALVIQNVVFLVCNSVAIEHGEGGVLVAFSQACPSYS